MVESRGCAQREGVYRWFSALASAKRAEFLCGLLDLCVPIELRFLGSCLEDLARKDYRSLRDAETRANSPAELSGLGDVADELVRSKLLLSVALLSTDNREAAGVLYRTLTRADTGTRGHGLCPSDARAEEQVLLLFTMAAHHPAFTFHQKRVLRQRLDQIHDVFQVPSGVHRCALNASTENTHTRTHTHSRLFLMHFRSLMPVKCAESGRIGCNERKLSFATLMLLL